MRIGFTGTREGMTKLQRLALEWLLDDRFGEFHHGDCVGADAEAHAIATAAKFKTHSHPPDNETMRAFTKASVEHEPLPYLERNKAIVHACSTLIAAPATTAEHIRSGTWSTVRYARANGVPVAVIYPNGIVHVELKDRPYTINPFEITSTEPA